MSEAAQEHYYVPEEAKWPIWGSIALTIMVCGFASYLNGGSAGLWFTAIGFGIFVVMLFGWFGAVVRESESGMYKAWEDTSFRMGMYWFIFSEVMFLLPRK